MTKKFVIVLKYITLSIGLLLGVLSCEKDFKNVGVNIVDNNVFSTDKYISEVIAYNQNMDNVRTNALEHYLLGVQRDPEFGLLEASIVTQLSLTTHNPDFGENAVIDTVIVDFPLEATLKGKKEDVDGNSVPDFVLDSVWRNGHGLFQLNIFELGTSLFAVDQVDPTKPKRYYSDDTFIKKNSTAPLFSNLVTADENDTLLIIKRFKYPHDHYPDLTEKEEYERDTIKKTEAKPSLKIPFDKDVFTSLFLENAASTDFASNANFQSFFKGLYIEALEQDDLGASLMFLNLKDAAMTIYFSYDVQKDEGADQDLNGNGINGEEDVWVRTPKSFSFPLTGIKANLFSRDITNSTLESHLNSTNTETGDTKLFVQGASGSNAIIKLFGADANNNDIPDELENLRSNNWLINEAKIVVYIENDNPTSWTPKKLYLYNVGEEDENEDGDLDDTQILDAMPQSILKMDGELKNTSDETPEKYTFLVTEYITELLKEDSEMKLHNLGIKVFDDHDTPNPRYITDTIIHKFNSNPKGIVLKGNLPNTEEQRIKLEIYYTKKN